MRISVVVILLISLLSISIQTKAAVQYTVTDLGTLGGPTSGATCINDGGIVVGYSFVNWTGPGNYHAFLYNGSTMLDLGTLGGQNSEAMGLNDNGQIMGWAAIDSYSTHAFLYSDSTMKDLGTLLGQNRSSWAYGINNSGTIVGYSNVNTYNSTYHAFVYSNSVMKDLGTLKGNNNSFALAINNNGDIVGYGDSHAFLYNDSTMKDLGTLGGSFSKAVDINDLGQIVGYSSTSAGVSVKHAFLYVDSSMLDLGTLGGTESYANSINNRGQIVGYSYTSGNVTKHAFVCDNAGTMQDLNDLIASNSGWILNTAKGINGTGQVVGEGTIGGKTHAFLLTPVPEPSTIALLVMGVIGLFASAWRQRNVTRILACVLALLTSTLGMAQAVTIETVPVGNINNAADAITGNVYGSVNYAYNIGKYEVTAGQYTEFLTAKAKTDTYGLYNIYMWSDDIGCKIQRTGSPGSYAYTVAPDYADRPVNFVSFWDAARFTNWLHNGQGLDGNTETGAYTLNGYNGSDGRLIVKNTGASWWVPSEDEWYKAAYHKNDGVTSNYFLYPTGSNSIPGRDLADGSGNNANIYGTPFPIDSGKYTTVKGEFQNSDSPYGTFDQGGNVFEWNDTVIGSSSRGLRGGSFYVGTPASSYRSSYNPSSENYYGVGFRVACVPEPSTIALLLIACIGGLLWWRRR